MSSLKKKWSKTALFLHEVPNVFQNLESKPRRENISTHLQ